MVLLDVNKTLMGTYFSDQNGASQRDPSNIQVNQQAAQALKFDDTGYTPLSQKSDNTKKLNINT
ncbi:MAG: hypothetical protein VKJ06_02990 [Vampirovibrionales bacterium]|nr:hypothetical protein [Vampirovibrionales bacterium]